MSSTPVSAWMFVALGCSVGPLIAFGINLLFYRKPAAKSQQVAPRPRVSVLIPARNEEQSILAAARAVLASRGVDFELIVLDDASTDATSALVAKLALEDPRVTLHHAPPLPAGWNGKQHACAYLSKLARYDLLCFLDADVRLAPAALEVLVAELHAADAQLLSGFPLEQTETWLEKLLIPLIHFVLLSYLPMPGLRRLPRVPSLAAGCGQFMLVCRDAYIASGGHAAIRETMHDGILLPKLLREKGFATDLVDLTDLASCRMYRNASEVWNGLSKNATEGMAAPARIVPFSVMLFFGQVMPAIWLGSALIQGAPLALPALAVFAGYAPRLIAMVRFRQSLLGAALHPAGVTILLALQWWSLARKLRGLQSTWKERVYSSG